MYHKEQLLEPIGQATIGSAAVWFEQPPPPDEAAQPVPQESGVFDGSEASAAAVGLGTLETEREVWIVDPEQDEDRRPFERKERDEEREVAP